MNNKKEYSFFEIYGNIEFNKLPSHIKECIDAVKVVGTSKKVLKLPNGQKYHMNNKLNDLSGSEWTYFTNSVLNTHYATNSKENDGYKFRKIHPSPKPPALLKDLICFFTKENEIVLDFFMGVGGTLIASSMAERRAVGIELNPIYIEAYKKATNSINLAEQPTFCGDSNQLLESAIISDYFKIEKASLILIDPPYFNMMSKEKTGDDKNIYGKISTPFTTSAIDLGNMSELDFWNSLINMIQKSLIYLKSNGHVIVFIKDMQPKHKSTNLLHAKMIEKINEIPNLNYIGMKIWADQTAKLFPYGYPYAFVATQIHQYILIFKKNN